MSLSAKSILFAALAMTAASNASAADLTTYQAPDAGYDRPPAFQWSGAYFGAHGGIASPKFNPFASGKGLTGGVQAGYNFQVGPVSSARSWRAHTSETTRYAYQTARWKSASGVPPRRRPA